MYNYKNHIPIPKSELQKDINYELCVHTVICLLKETRIFAFDFSINYNMLTWFLTLLRTSYNSQVQLQNY